MKKLLICFLLVSAGSSSRAQQQRFKAEDYFYYRNHLYLNTSSVLLNAAGLKSLAKDTAAAISYIQKAAAEGLFDTMFITTSSRLRFIQHRKEWPRIKNMVLNNARRYAEPENMEVSFADIDRFWAIYDQLDEPGADELIMKEYILKGSVGLRTFFEKRMALQPSNLLAQVRKRKKYLASIRPVTLALKNYRPAILEAAKKINEIYPDAYFPPTYFTIGAFDAFGTADGGAGQLVGAEFLVDKNTVDTSELAVFEKNAIADSSRITGIVIHELIHSLQQTAQDQTLLARSIDEGAADFISQLALGYNINSKIHVYGNANEQQLKKQFSSVMSGTDTGEWLYNGVAATGERPADLGYFMGYKICEAYYNSHANKSVAVKDILNIQDYKMFLQKSGYPLQ